MVPPLGTGEIARHPAAAPRQGKVCGSSLYTTREIMGCFTPQDSELKVSVSTLPFPI